MLLFKFLLMSPCCRLYFGQQSRDAPYPMTEYLLSLLIVAEINVLESRSVYVGVSSLLHIRSRSARTRHIVIQNIIM